MNEKPVRSRWALRRPPLFRGERKQIQAVFLPVILLSLTCAIGLSAEPIALGGRLPQPGGEVVLWWALSSATKIQPQTPAPTQASSAVQIRCARNERECVQVVARPEEPLNQVRLEAGALTGPGNAVLPAGNLEILQARYVEVAHATDKAGKAGLWPDPLVPLSDSVNLEPGINHVFWIRVFVPRTAAAGTYRGALKLRAQGWEAEVPLKLTVYDFALPDQMTCQTALGFSPGEVFRYQKIRDEPAKREVLAKYWADLAAHHISPYDPAPLDSFKVTWPDVHPPRTALDDWQNLRLVHNEVHSGQSALLVYDDKVDANVVVTYQPMIPIPPKGLRLRGWYRTAIPEHRFTVSLNHYDANKTWMSGRNRDFTLIGDGRWQKADYLVTDFPPGARFVRLNLMATVWSDSGDKIGLVWFDDLSVQDAGTGEELVKGGDFEQAPRTEPCVPADQLRPGFDFRPWDAAMTQAIDSYHFNSFSVPIPGLGGGTFFEASRPNLLGFAEDSPEYPLLLGSYCQQIEAHLRAKAWLNQAFIYWFDEPSEDQFPFLQTGFAKLKRYCPDIRRMITKCVEPGLVGGPNLWCPISNQYQQAPSDARRALGERFWWYICTGPKAPYAGEFIDHAAPELRIWLWQTFQRNINGILVWQCNYWNSPTAYPDPNRPQNPYEDPMSWTEGYGTPSGTKSPWGNGDGRFIYPPPAAGSANPAQPVLQGPVDSLRWEQLRDGIEDYEYLTILRRKFEARRNSLGPERVAQYEQLLTVPPTITRSATDFTRDGAPIELRRDQIARAIEAL